jgi:phage antirepressor YoqD-like protein/predicted transcriptional regulator
MNELTNDKTMSVQELADSLHVSDRTVQRSIEKQATILKQVKTNNQGGYLLTEAQCTHAKTEHDNHPNTEIYFCNPVSKVIPNAVLDVDQITTKQLADSLEVDIKTIQRAVDSLDINVERKGSNHSMYFTKEQATAIKIELQNHSKVSKNGFNTLEINNDLEMLLVQKKLDTYKNMRISELEQQLSIAQPKADVYDAICDSSTLQDLQTVSQTIGITNVFKVLIADGIIKKELSKDGTMFYRPYSDYNDYLVLKDGKPYVVDGISHVRPRIFVTGKGITWLTKKYGK